jgi:hypothetical protein
VNFAGRKGNFPVWLDKNPHGNGNLRKSEGKSTGKSDSDLAGLLQKQNLRVIRQGLPMHEQALSTRER